LTRAVSRGRGRPTIDDVARAAGVSRGTVSRVLNGGHYVSQDARNRVVSAMRETRYVANQSARSLATGRANAVGFVIPETQDRLFEDPNFNVLLRATTQALVESDIALVLLLAGPGQGRSKVLRYIQAGHVDGVMVVSAHSGDPLLAQLLKLSIPAVVCGRPLDEYGRVPYVAADDREGARLMTRHLTETGRGRIAMITGPLDTPGGIDRLHGFRDVLGPDVPRERILSASTYSHAAGQEAMRQLLQQAPDIDAVFVASDLVAAGAMAELYRQGVGVPGQIAVGGFDDSIIATTTQPALTTIRQPLDDVAGEMVEVLLASVAGRHVSASRLLPVSLVRRDST
jgi:DNA-binding LacI/PurR family transcriptional regulator